MQNDDVVWSCINKGFCSFKITSKKQKFCKNEYNVTGLCSRASCPLANSQYATVREEDGIIYLFIRTAERIYTPKTSWERVKLSRNHEKALHQIKENLLLSGTFPSFIKSKCRQRFEMITKYLTRMRKMQLRRQKKIVPLQRKIERRDRRREEKALIAAKGVEPIIIKKLMEKMKKGEYDTVYNFPKLAFNKALKVMEGDEQEELDVEEEEDEEEVERAPKISKDLERELEADDGDDDEVTEYVADDSEEEEEELEYESDSGIRENVEVSSDFESDSDDIEEIVPSTSKKGKIPLVTRRNVQNKRSRPRVEIEYEIEEEPKQKLRR